MQHLPGPRDERPGPPRDGVHHHRAVGSYGEGQDVGEHAERVECPAGVRAELQAGADLAELFSPLDQMNPAAVAGELEGGGQAADAAADDKRRKLAGARHRRGPAVVRSRAGMSAGAPSVSLRIRPIASRTARRPRRAIPGRCSVCIDNRTNRHFTHRLRRCTLIAACRPREGPAEGPSTAVETRNYVSGTEPVSSLAECVREWRPSTVRIGRLVDPWAASASRI
jgi:hypothetical protein